MTDPVGNDRGSGSGAPFDSSATPSSTRPAERPFDPPPGTVGDVDVDGDVERVRRAIEQVRGHPAQRRHRDRNAAEAGLRAARLSAAIEGVPLSVPTTDVSPVLVGAVRATSALPHLVSAWQRSPRQVLARLHLLAAAGSTGEDELGRPRADGAAAAALARVSALVLTGGHPAPVLVALVHRELVVAAPFAVANGLVARAAARLTMMATGLDPDGLTVPEIAYLRWFRTGSRSVPLHWEIGQWRVRTAGALVDGAREATSIAESAS